MNTLCITSPIAIGRACSKDRYQSRYALPDVRIRTIDRTDGPSSVFADATDGHMLVRTQILADLPPNNEALVASKPLAKTTSAGKTMVLVKKGDHFDDASSTDYGASQSFPDVECVGPMPIGSSGAFVRLSVPRLRRLLESIEDRSGTKKERDAQTIELAVPSKPGPIRVMGRSATGAPILAMLMPVKDDEDPESSSSERYTSFEARWNGAWKKGAR